jgi:methylated-DNA-[protein]-cysteine S-methyltransferase
MSSINSGNKKISPFAAEVIAVVRKIPKGKTLTYKQVAERSGNPKAARAVGTILNRYNYKVTGIPCHRVVRSDGSPGGYIDGAAKKQALLKKEGSVI